MADLFDGYSNAGDPGAGRDPNKFYGFDAKSHADAINQNTHGRPVVSTITSSATPAINTDNCTAFEITALATPITSMSSGLSGTPQSWQRLWIRIKDNGSPQAIAWGASWRAIGVTLPTLTIPNGTLYVEAYYNSADSVWDVVTVRKQLVNMTVKGANTANAASVAIPTHQAGDLILLFAFRSGASTLPTVPSASGTVPAWNTLDSTTGTTQAAGITAWFIATANNHTSGTWTGATDMIAVVISGEKTTAPIGGHAIANGGNASGSNAPAITLTDASGRSIIVELFAHAATTAWAAAPAGYTAVSVGTNVAVYTKNDTTSDGALTQGVTSSASGYCAAAVEIVAAT